MSRMFQNATNFSQDLSNWCAEKIPSKPSYFDRGAAFENESNLHPNWDAPLQLARGTLQHNQRLLRTNYLLGLGNQKLASKHSPEEYNMTTARLHPIVARLTLFLLMLLSTSALAFDGLTVGAGLGLPSAGAVPMNVRASYPVYRFALNEQPIDLRARLDITTASSFNSIPTFAVSAVAIAVDGDAYPYLGVGGALSFVPLDPTITLFSAQFLLGVQVPFGNGFSGAIEGALATNAYVTSAQLILAVDYTFGR